MLKILKNMSIEKIHNNKVVGELEYIDNKVCVLYVDLVWREEGIATDLLDKFYEKSKYDNIYKILFKSLYFFYLVILRKNNLI